MSDLEKVLKGLECCAEDVNELGDCLSNDCPYKHKQACCSAMARDALELLKEQEAVVPVLVYKGANKQHNNYKCPKCHTDLYYGQMYCEWCGRKVQWE